LECPTLLIHATVAHRVNIESRSLHEEDKTCCKPDNICNIECRMKATYFGKRDGTIRHLKVAGRLDVQAD